MYLSVYLLTMPPLCCLGTTEDGYTLLYPEFSNRIFSATYVLTYF